MKFVILLLFFLLFQLLCNNNNYNNKSQFVVQAFETTTTMQSLSATTPGSFRDVLQYERNTPIPTLSDNEQDVLIRVIYTDLNPVDLQKLKRQSGIPGYSGSGIIVETSSKSSVSKFHKGDRVIFLTVNGGTYAEYVIVPEQSVCIIPDTISFIDAAIVPLAGCTAYESLIKLGLQPNNDNNNNKKSLLIIGGAGGVGSWATLLVKSWYGDNIHVTCTASTDTSKQWCYKQGADQVITHDEIESVFSGGINGSIDRILCLTEPVPTLFKILSEIIRPYGSICLVVAGQSINNLDLGFCFFKCIDIVTETVFSSFRTNFKHFQPANEMKNVLQLIENNQIKSPLSLSCDWKNALNENGILDKLESGHTHGKMCMQIGSLEDKSEL